VNLVCNILFSWNDLLCNDFTKFAESIGTLLLVGLPSVMIPSPMAQQG
jgi:hypothetical protein